MKKIFSLKGIFGRFASLIDGNPPHLEWDWQAVALTIALVQISSGRLVVSDWVPSLEIVQTLSLYAVILGLVLGYSSFKRRNVIWAMVEYGILLIPFQLLKAIERSEDYFGDLRILFRRILDSMNLFWNNQPVYDTLFFLLLTSLGFWVVGSFAGYHLTRYRSFLHVTLTPGLIMLIVQNYDPWVPLRAWGLAVYIFIALVLLGRLQFLESRNIWKKKRVFLSSDSEWEFTRSVLTTAAIVVFIAWALPGALTNIKPAAESWRNFTEPITKRLSDAVSALDSPYAASSGGDFYGTNLKLGSNAPVSDSPVFFVEADDAEADVLRYYWRGRVYDRYEKGQWMDTNSLRRDFDPDEDEILIADPLNRAEVGFTFTMNFPKQELLYAPSEMVWVDRKSRIVINVLPGNLREVTAWSSDTSLAAGDRYKVRALIANPTVQKLRASGTEYPEWVTRDYLEVPQEMEPRLKALAERITAPSKTPYDKAQAITSYLRNEIEYQAKITEAPARGQDPLLWVLFEHKQGFCMYYASAEVLMLRTIGIPARMAVGFAQGTYDEEQGRYKVARLNSHAWPEVYFPRIGWIEFEPTASQDPIERPLEVRDASLEDSTGTITPNGQSANPDEDLENLPGINPALEDVNLPDSASNSPWKRFFFPGVFLILLTIAIILVNNGSLSERLPVYLVERYEKSGGHSPPWLSNWAKWAKLMPIEKSFHIINLSLRWLGKTLPTHATPEVRAQILAKSLPSAEKAIETLLHEHEKALFTSQPANLAEARRAGWKILVETWRTRMIRFEEYLKGRYN